MLKASVGLHCTIKFMFSSSVKIHSKGSSCSLLKQSADLRYLKSTSRVSIRYKYVSVQNALLALSN